MIKQLFCCLFMMCSLDVAAQQSTDTKALLAEKMFGFLIENKADSLYENMSEQVKPMLSANQFQGVLQQVEAQVGKYQGHDAWETQEIMGQTCYVSVVRFEKDQLGALIVFDEENKMLGIQFLPVDAIKKE